MGNAWCCLPSSYIIDYSQRKVVISQGIQCCLLVPASYCPHACISKPICSPERHCRCGVYSPSGDWKPTCNDEKNKYLVNSPKTTLKSKLNSSQNHCIIDSPDALVSLSETFSESSLEDFLSRKRLSRNQKQNSKLNCLPENKIPNLFNNSSYYKSLNRSNNFTTEEKPRYTLKTFTPNYKRSRIRKKKKIRVKNQLDSSSNNSLSTENSLSHCKTSEKQLHIKIDELNNSAETTSNEESKRVSDTVCRHVTPKKSILKHCDSVKEVIEEDLDDQNKPKVSDIAVYHDENALNPIIQADKLSNNSLPLRSLSALSNHDSLDQLMSLLKSSNFSTGDNMTLRSVKSKSNECINKTVNFMKDLDETKPFETPQKNTSKPGYQIQPDGKIKKRLILRETHKLFDILNDPSDRRIRAICDRYQCDLEIFVRPPKIGLMYFAVEILAPDKYSLRMCVRELDSSMKWCISSQLF